MRRTLNKKKSLNKKKTMNKRKSLNKKKTLNKRKKQNKNTRKQVGGYFLYPSRSEQEIAELRQQRADLIACLLQTRILPMSITVSLINATKALNDRRWTQERFNEAFKGLMADSKKFLISNAEKIKTFQNEVLQNNFGISPQDIKMNNRLIDNYFEIPKSKVLDSGGGGRVVPMRERMESNDYEGRQSDITPTCFGGLCDNS